MSEIRIACPDCGEKILSHAKKCRYCGKRLNKYITNATIPKLYFVWLSTLFAFFCSLFFSNRATGDFVVLWLLIILILVVFGGVMYLKLVMKIFNNSKLLVAKVFGIITLLTFISFFWVFFNFGDVQAALGISKPQIPQPSTDNANTMTPADVVKAINDHRKKQGLSPFKHNYLLNNASQKLAEDICDKGIFKNPNQEQIGNFAKASGYDFSTSNIALAESLSDPIILTKSLLLSSQTSSSILSKNLKEIGAWVTTCTFSGIGNTVFTTIYFASPVEIEKPTDTTISSGNNQQTRPQTSNQIECIGPDKKTFTTTMEKCTELNEKWGSPIDYMTNCDIHPDCGGGTVRMSKSQCDLPCSGQPTPNTTNTNKAAEQNSKSDVYCYDNVTGRSYYTTSGEQCNKDNSDSLCRNGAKLTYDYCMDNCLRDQNSRSSNCIYNYNDSEQTTCLDASHGVYQQCMDACGKTYQDDSAKCN